MRAMLIAGALIAAHGACGSSDKSASARDAIVEAWKGDKLAPSALTAATVAFGKDCKTGTVEGIEVLLCNFPTAAEAKAAEDAGLAWIGQATGASQARGAALVVIADRKKSDPNGRMINRLLKLAPN
jgi:hypothetical protein